MCASCARVYRLITALTLLAGCASAESGPPRNRGHVDPDEGGLSSVKPRIPEPMVFDLVRPLGAARGELEVNSLFRLPVAREGRLLWAPEVEYTFADGYGIAIFSPSTSGRLTR